jgi:hypothetical protein
MEREEGRRVLSLPLAATHPRAIFSVFLLLLASKP